MEVREALLSDAQAINRLFAVCLSEIELLCLWPGEVSFDLEFREDWIQERQERSTWCCFVAVAEDRVVGLVATRSPLACGLDHRAYITALVEPGYRRGGVARALIRRLEAWAVATPEVRRVEAHCLARNEAILAMCREFGMETESVERDGFMRPDGGFEDVVVSFRVFKGPQ